MKDAYSFHLSQVCLQTTYDKMFHAYCNVFERICLDYRPVIADNGSIGGSGSHEFHVLADSGEDDIAFSNGSDYAANVEMAEALAPESQGNGSQDLTKVPTPNAKTIPEVSALLGLPEDASVKTLIVLSTPAEDGSQGLVALVLRGDHDVNELKAEKHPLIASPFAMADEEAIKAAIGCGVGSIGPVGLALPIIVDRSAAALADFVCGANTDDVHYTGANWSRDVPEYEVFDLRNIQAGDPSPCGQGTIEIKRGIEVGHIFQLGNKYSQAMNCGVLTETGKHETLTMGCYGIGVSRIMAAAIEQNHDKYGIKWPDAIAPFTIAIIPMNMHKSHRIKEVAEKLYEECLALGVEVLFDDRKERPGVMFNDMELIGVPHSIVIGERNLDNQEVEYKNRRTGEKKMLNIADLSEFIGNL